MVWVTILVPSLGSVDYKSLLKYFFFGTTFVQWPLARETYCSPADFTNKQLSLIQTVKNQPPPPKKMRHGQWEMGISLAQIPMDVFTQFTPLLNIMNIMKCKV